MRKALWTYLLLWGGSTIRGLQAGQNGQLELARLKMSLIYVRSIKVFRFLFMSLFSMGVCLILLLAGLALFYVSLFLYASLSLETKMFVGFLSAAVFLLASMALFLNIFSADKWLAIFHAEGILAHLKQETSMVGQEGEDATQQR